MDAKGVDRPVALVVGPPGVRLAAEVDRLLASGHEVHLGADLVRGRDLSSPVHRGLRPVSGGRESLLAAAVATRRPLAVAVLVADGAHHDLLRTVRAVMDAWGGGEVVLVPTCPPPRRRAAWSSTR